MANYNGLFDSRRDIGHQEPVHRRDVVPQSAFLRTTPTSSQPDSRTRTNGMIAIPMPVRPIPQQPQQHHHHPHHLPATQPPPPDDVVPGAAAIRRIPPETSLSLVRDDEDEVTEMPSTGGSVTSSKLDDDDDDDDDDDLSFNEDDPDDGENLRYDKVLEDIGLSDLELRNTETKVLNQIIKSKGISKEKAKRIKQHRRTLKNRKYASTCRDKREREEKELEDDIRSLDKQIVKLDEEITKMDSELLFRRDYIVADLQRRISALKEELKEYNAF